jgi:2-C-methyl-D-erythritol 4-phosphate cytidylyltransferase
VSLAAVVLAGGSGTRLGAGRNKALLPLGGEPLLAHSVRRAASVSGISVVVVVVRPGDEEEAATALADLPAPHESSGPPVLTAPGGSSRHRSELSALQLLRPRIENGEIDVVAIHDAARPLASPALWEAVVAAARTEGGALPVRPGAGVVSTAGFVGPPPGEQWTTVQTPQAFHAAPLLVAYLAAERDGFEGTDTAACVVAYTDLRVVAVPGEAANVKVTYPGDLPLAEALLAASG